jgi:hypothetical protein
MNPHPKLLTETSTGTLQMKKRRGLKKNRDNDSDAIDTEDFAGVSYHQYLDAKRPRGRTDVSKGSVVMT